MKALTTSQQSIIDNLLMEFQCMNEVNPIPFTLFDAQPYLAKLNEKESEDKETSLHNKAMRNELMGRLNDYVNVLNNDFNNAGLYLNAYFVEVNDLFVIQADKSKANVHCGYNVHIHIKQANARTKHGFLKIVKYKYAVESITDDLYETFEGILKSKQIQDKIFELLEQTRIPKNIIK